jgi:glycosyl transferase family 2
VERGHPGSGSAWQAGAVRASGEFICLSADDHEPEPGWWEPLVEAAEMGYCPCSVVLNADGSLQSAGMNGYAANLIVADWHPVEHTLTPFMSRAQWELVGWIPTDLHLCTDLWVSARLARHGVQAVVRSGSRTVHHLHPVGRGAGMEEHARNVHDRALYLRYLEEAA